MRTELPYKADAVGCSNASETLEQCLLPRRFERLVFIVVDALRYDFIAPVHGSCEGGEVQGHCAYSNKVGAVLVCALPLARHALSKCTDATLAETCA